MNKNSLNHCIIKCIYTILNAYNRFFSAQNDTGWFRFNWLILTVFCIISDCKNKDINQYSSLLLLITFLKPFFFFFFFEKNKKNIKVIINKKETWFIIGFISLLFWIEWLKSYSYIQWLHSKDWRWYFLFGNLNLISQSTIYYSFFFCCC